MTLYLQWFKNQEEAVLAYDERPSSIVVSQDEDHLYIIETTSEDKYLFYFPFYFPVFKLPLNSDSMKTVAMIAFGYSWNEKEEYNRVFKTLPFGGKRIKKEEASLSEEKEFWDKVQSKRNWKYLYNSRLNALFLFDPKNSYSEYYILPEDVNHWSYKALLCLTFFSKGKTMDDIGEFFNSFSNSELEGFQIKIDERLEA